jgi:hypothetical protein
LWKITPFLEKLATVKDVREYIRDVVSMNQINYKRINEILEEEDSGDSEEEKHREIKIVTKKNEKVLNSSTSSAGINKPQQIKGSTTQTVKIETNEDDKNQRLTTKSNLNSSYNTGFKTEKNEKQTGIYSTYNSNNLKSVKTQERTSSIVVKKKEDAKKNIITQTAKPVTKTTSTFSSTVNNKSNPSILSSPKKSSSVIISKAKTTTTLTKTINKTAVTSVRTSSQTKVDLNASYRSNVKTSNQNTNNIKPVSPVKSTNKCNF